MKPFKRRRRGGITASFEPGEAHLIASLAAQVVELLRDRNGESESSPDPLASQLGIGGPALPPEDPVLQRLLPDAYADDAADAAEFRRYTEQSLTSAKVANAEALIGSLVDGGLQHDGEEEQVVEVELDPAAAQAWLRSLTDIRLALSVRLGIESDEDTLLVHESDDEAVVAVAEIYDWLGFVQETLVGTLD
ncbi:hypothetical protein ASD11_03015 [Aeromicrobium sp. Root495]|uniref:DUF2017 domain-containing protein n=1 Tax=Aeromicrobium sp. Root495 TaxID=1736550 RepID=UPI0006F5BCF5|nr:DUF2017 domain-containing protein [Aeromicrobium sp. Root495]KQY58640.1 hypothetical protein ASD11_03015 [Aeromicrobium sp. Root495]